MRSIGFFDQLIGGIFMDIEQLTAFTRIARVGSFTRAAQALGLPQPTISGRIRALEEAVGGALFHRNGRKLTLTERGVRFLPYAERTLELLAEGVERAGLAEEGQFGRVTLGAMVSMAASPLGPAVDLFLRTHPRVDLWIESGHSNQVMEMLRDGIAQLGLITAPYLDSDIETIARFRDPLVLVTGPDHPLARSEPRSLREVVHEANPFLWIMYSLEMDHLRQRMHAEPGAREVDLPAATLREVLLSGTGAGIMTASTVRSDIEQGRLVRIETTDANHLIRETALVALAHRALPNAAIAFAGIIEREARRLGFAVDGRGSTVLSATQATAGKTAGTRNAALSPAQATERSLR
jgi:DNA-binding transcriptional LysR family regulator